MNKSEPSLILEVLKNATFRSEWARDSVAQFVKGVYKEKHDENSTTELIIRLTDVYAFGDLNEDGAKDAVAVLRVDPGGSGTFYYLAAMLNQNVILNNIDSEFLGDRVKIKAVSVRKSIVSVDMITHSPSDGMCCPTRPVIRKYKLEENAFVRVSDED